MINNNKMVLSLKVDGKNYLPIKQIQRCENINQLIWMLLISVTMNRNTIVIGLALMIIIFIFSHCYLKNKVSKIVRVSFEIMVSMYGFFFLFLISYLKSF